MYPIWATVLFYAIWWVAVALGVVSEEMTLPTPFA